MVALGRCESWGPSLPAVPRGFGGLSVAGTPTLGSSTLRMGTVACWLSSPAAPLAPGGRDGDAVPTGSGRATFTVAPRGAAVILGARMGGEERTVAPGSADRSPGGTRGRSRGRRATRAFTWGLLPVLGGSGGFFFSGRGGTGGVGPLSVCGQSGGGRGTLRRVWGPRGPGCPPGGVSPAPGSCRRSQQRPARSSSLPSASGSHGGSSPCALWVRR